MNSLTHTEVKQLFDYAPDTGVVTRRNMNQYDARTKEIVGDMNSAGYLSVWIKPRRYQLHRIIWFWVHGVWPRGVIDHINRISTDNRLVNLRDVSQAENVQNQRRSLRNWSGHTGVHWYARSGRWHAQIAVNGKKHHLGYFTSISDASAAYQAAKLIHHPTAPTAH